jgi:predicted ATPase
LKVKKKIVLSGGPGSGKTTLINLLKERGYRCFDEISRTFIQRGKEDGIDNIFSHQPLDFSNFLWEGRKDDYTSANAIELSNSEKPWVFFDRGLPDVTAYLNHQGIVKQDWENQLKEFKYELVFLIAPVASIYKKDDLRMESFKESLALHESLKKAYLEIGEIIEVPFLSPEERLDFILTHCHD